ncbi:MAG: anthranilate phosphoribosyltransferase [Magnetovibrionaceae bacterium]
MTDQPTGAEMKPLLALVADGKALDSGQAEKAFDIIMSGEATPSQIGAFLMALRVRGETAEEITAAARVMRAKVLKVTAPEGAIDIVGTGGDNSGTFNISTSTAFVVAGCGVPVAKHGNRALSSKSGAADILSALGINTEADMSLVERAIADAGIGFLFAPRHHSAMRHVMPTRMELGTRTLFNLLGPLTNPALVTRQMTGAFSKAWIEPMAAALGALGLERAWVVNGSDGLDEITLTGPTHVAEWRDGKVTTYDIRPEDAGLAPCSPDDLKGGDATLNAAATMAMLEGAEGPLRDVVLLNAAASLMVAGKADDLKTGVGIAAQSIDSGAARAALDKLVAITNGAA